MPQRRLYVEAADQAAVDLDNVEIPTSGGGPIEFAKDLGRNARGVGEAALTVGSSVLADICRRS